MLLLNFPFIKHLKKNAGLYQHVCLGKIWSSPNVGLNIAI